MPAPEVETRCGKLRGGIQKNIDGLDFYAFKGIPYAKPPVGQLRFQDSVPAEPWSGTRDALDFGPTSAQYDPVSNVWEGSDDCLYLNVYTKTLEPSARLPVMVWIHGGGFFFGSGNDVLYGPDFLMKKDVVLVTLNYRLGIFGFLNLDHETAPGNQGLKDQVLALQWVCDNIERFGGDAGNVTIFGESAGGASVHFLTMSPLAKGLFHKAISQSGVAINPWATSVGEQKTTAIQICEYLGKKVSDPVDVVKFLQTVETMKIIEAQEKIGRKLQAACYNPFCPGIDSKSKNPFLPISKEIAAKEGSHVPYLLGHNNREGTFILTVLEKETGSVNDEKLAAFLHPQSVNILQDYNMTMEDLKNMYLNEKSLEDAEGLTDMMGDILFVQGIHKIIKAQVERSAAPTYMYQFTYDKGYSLPKLMFNSTLRGATHMDELFYIFSMKLFEVLKLEPPQKGTPLYRVMEQMLELWTNFAKTGMPTPTVSDLVPLYWQPVVDGTVLRYLNIGEDLRMEKMLNIEERFCYKKNSSPNLH